MTFARRLAHAHRIATHGGDMDLIDLHQVYGDIDEGDAGKSVIELIEESDCIEPGGCVFLARCGQVTCIHCGRPG